MKTSGLLKIFFLVIMLLSLAAQILFVNEIIFWINVISFILLSLLSQFKMIVFYRRTYDFWLLKYVFAAGQLIHSVCYLALLCSFNQYGTWKYFLIISVAFFLIVFVFNFVYLKHFLVKQLKNIFFINVLIPSLIIFFLGIIPFTMSDSDFYNTFNKERKNQTYEQFQKQDKPHNSDQFPLF